jgi:trimethylamine--corrinoid protein Co-methyltransferase
MADTLTGAARRTIHERALELLTEDGLRIEHHAAREVLSEAGAAVDGERVRLPASLVEDAVDDAPASFRWRAREDEKSVVVGAGDPVIAPVRGPRYVKRYGEERHRARMQDFQELLELVHMDPTVSVAGYDLCSPEGYSLPGNPGGYEQAAVGYELLEGLFTGTDKPIVGSARRDEEAKATLDMARIAFQDEALAENYVLGILHVRSPRVLNEPMVAGLLRFAREGQPLSISSGAIAGASAPHSFAETAVLSNAEALGGLVLAQVVNPGTPVVYGQTSTVYDPMAESVTYGTPRGSVFAEIVPAMGEFYDLPVRGHGGMTDAMDVDDQSGSDSMYHVQTALEAGADLLLNAVGVLDTHAVVSPEKLVIDAERFRAVQAARTGAAATRERLEAGDVDLATIREAGPAATFYDDRPPETLADASQFEREIAVRTSYDDWLADGGESVGERARARVESLRDAYEQPPIDPAVEAELADYVEAHSDR